MRDQDAANLDETGWYEGKAEGGQRRAWLWLAATALVAVFRITSSRGSEVAKALLGTDFAGFLTTDRWGAYNWYETALRQLCWSHLTRDFQGFIDRGGEGARIGQELLDERNRMFKWWQRVRDGTLAREAFERWMKEVEQKVGLLLREAECRWTPSVWLRSRISKRPCARRRREPAPERMPPRGQPFASVRTSSPRF
ncbi:transposase [Cystobacter fuscus]|nr:transposase [Cystobacter fuscus]